MADELQLEDSQEEECAACCKLFCDSGSRRTSVFPKEHIKFTREGEMTLFFKASK